MIIRLAPSRSTAHDNEAIASMSRLTDLLRRVEQQNPALARDLTDEVKALANRRAFGLNFERHVPETVELPGRRVRRGDKVRFRASRGQSSEDPDTRPWLVTRIETQEGQRTAHLTELRPGANGQAKTATGVTDDLVVVAEFRDPIYPGLRSTGTVERGGDKPFHTVINGENYHALEALLFAHEGKVDCIYIDPPYNTRDKDWKYNNDYVDSDDAYRHSKWLAMMERRLKLAKRLLNPENSVLIVTIDEKEYLRLGLLLEQVFSDARIQMISSLINPANQARPGAFGRSDEYLYFIMLGSAAPSRLMLDREWVSSKGRTFTGRIRWDLLRRSGTSPRRQDSPGGFYPIYVDPAGPSFHSVGAPLPTGESQAPSIVGKVAVLPIRKNGTEGRWQVGPDTLRSYMTEGRVKIGGSDERGYVIYYLKPGEFRKLSSGDYPVIGQAADGSLLVGEVDGQDVLSVPSTQWRISSHDSTQYGSRLLADVIPKRRFPYPKSLYAVEDALRFFVKEKPEAVILDFFAGSGTTAHAVVRLNRQDGGRRRSIMVTNNEVSEEEARGLRRQGRRPGDPEWESLGICEYITKPRIRTAITGRSPEGEPIRGDYKFTDEFPMADGFEENAEFFDLTYEDPEHIRHDLAFAAIAPLLWMRAGSEGRRIDCPTDSFDVADTYAVLFNVDAAAGFTRAVVGCERLRVAYIVTDDESQFQLIAGELPRKLETVRLYEAYLQSFQHGAGEF